MIARMARDAAHAGERMTLSVKLDHFSSSEVEGNDDEILEGARSEQRSRSFCERQPLRRSRVGTADRAHRPWAVCQL